MSEQIVGAMMGTALTWGVTAAGSAVVFFAKPSQSFLDGCLGFAAGVMLAASYWSLLAPSIEFAEHSGVYGSFAFLPAAVGLLAGAWFVYLADRFFPSSLLELQAEDKKRNGSTSTGTPGEWTREHASAQTSKFGSRVPEGQQGSPSIEKSANQKTAPNQQRAMRQRVVSRTTLESGGKPIEEVPETPSTTRWRRTLLLAVAVTVHNIPEGLAVGVAFGSVGRTPMATIAGAWALAIGIALQNFPEGIAVSLPLHRAGISKRTSFWYGQLSGVVEPIAGLFGCLFISVAEPALPYMLGFAAGAMIYVVLDDIVPEVCTGKNATLANWAAMLGFVVMMSLDVALG
eukprot:m.65867 g.65867  ORF g.65867 m.65867 type:complete len:344 (-) comp13564_c1_seq2:134-1165(-)